MTADLREAGTLTSSGPASTDEDTTTGRHGSIVVVCSPKGGSGKTVLATNLAVALNGCGQRVCLLDLDLEFGDVGIALGLEPQRSLIDAVTAEVPEDVDNPIELLTTSFRAGLDCILAPFEPSAVDRIPLGLVADLLPLLTAAYDAVVVDTETHLSAHVLAALDLADVVVVVAKPEIPTLKSIRLFLDTLDQRGQTHATRLLVCNTADVRGSLAPAEVGQALEMSVAATIPASPKVTESLNRGNPVAVSEPGHPVSQAITALATAALALDRGADARPSRRLRRLKRSSG